MPPSGFNKKQSHFILGFLNSVSLDLKKEGIQKKLTPSEALAQEIKNIDTILSKNKENSDLETGILLMTKKFYLELLNIKPATYDEMMNSKETVFADFEKQILEVHVPEIRQVV